MTGRSATPHYCLITLEIAPQSNGVCYTYGQTIGVGAGQQSRILHPSGRSEADNWQLRRMDKVLNFCPSRDDVAKPNRDNAIDVYVGDTEDVIGDDV